MTDLTNSVREAYALSDEGVDFKRVATKQRQEFDAWLQEERRIAAANAWDEAAEVVSEWMIVRLNPPGPNGPPDPPSNPYD